MTFDTPAFPYRPNPPDAYVRAAHREMDDVKASVNYSECVAGSPAQNGVCSDSECVCHPSPDPALSTSNKTFTIDITPEGCKTPEGVEKVNTAMKAFQESREEVARLATLLVNQHKDDIKRQLKVSGEDEALDAFRDLIEAVDTRLEAQDAFLRAVVGR